MNGSGQLELLGDPAAVGPADTETMRPLAARLPAGVRLGTSSWSFPGWAGLVYDRAADRRALAATGLSAYARHPLLRTVCVDRSWYGAVPPGTWADFARQVPRDFRFVIKAPGEATMPRRRGSKTANPRFLDPGPAADAVAAAAEGLGSRLGAVVFQFPPAAELAAKGFADRLAAFLEALPPTVHRACEIRTPGLLGPAYAAALRHAGAVHCFTVHPAMPGPLEQRERLGETPAGPLIVRWNLGHGRAYEAARERYWPFDRLVDPDPTTREQITQLARGACERGESAWVLVNNKAEGSAPRSIQALADLLAGGDA